MIGVPVVITEKLDGENCGITAGGVYARSHADFTVSPWSRAVRELHALVKNDIDEDTYLFGENMEGIHSIEYSNLKSYFYLFGVRQGTYWASWKDVKELAFLMDLAVVPELFSGVIKDEQELRELVESLASQESSLGGKREGIVIRREDGFFEKDFSTSVMKWVRKGHISTDEHWTRNWRKAKIIY